MENLNKIYLQMFAEGDEEEAPVDNTIKSADLARVRDVDFTLQFEKGIESLMNMLGVTRKVAKKAGETLKAYKATGTLEDGSVAEGEDIPLSKYETTWTAIGEAELSKWRKRTTAEAISEKGFQQAVNDTTTKMRKDVQSGIKGAFISALGEEGTTPAVASGTTVGFQKTIAKVWGRLQVLFEDTSIESVYFVNPMDVAEYLGGAQITTQTAFGMSYIENFLGLGTVILDSGIPAGTIYGTAVDNLVLYYVDVNGSDMAQAFDMTSDETGLVGIHSGAVYHNGSYETVVFSGVGLFAERIDGIVVGTITATA